MNETHQCIALVHCLEQRRVRSSVCAHIRLLPLRGQVAGRASLQQHAYPAFSTRLTSLTKTFKFEDQWCQHTAHARVSMMLVTKNRCARACVCVCMRSRVHM